MKKRVLIAAIIMVCAGIIVTICMAAIRMEKKMRLSHFMRHTVLRICLC